MSSITGQHDFDHMMMSKRGNEPPIGVVLRVARYHVKGTNVAL
jgi:hypothetical protein